ncbi:MAG TPA: ABC transporter ATP-binding protein [Thermomicrobiales bacterium]|nr:ABC transporter ATP-binding protein [Thermomicrobiales bacterium]
MATVELVNLRKTYRDVEAVRRFSQRIEEGEFFSLLGPSGCGKTTTLRMIAGFVRPTEGDVFVAGQNVTDLPPEKREIGIVFQNYAIFPHMDVFNNIAYGLKMRKFSKGDIRQRVEQALATVGLAGYGRRYQRELSGGEQQRVALARVLVIEPRILLLDEPLSALDKKLREEMKYWIKDLQQKLRITTIYVTHDQNEALTMSDRIAVMNRGVVEQVGTPQEIYEKPVSRFVTDFIGESNILAGEVVGVVDGTVELAFLNQRVVARRTCDVRVGDLVHFVVRPENVRLGETANGHGINTVRGTVRSTSYQGALIRHEVVVGDQTVIVESQNTPGVAVGSVAEEVTLGWPVESTALLVD